jgi:exopolysaccharide biosynthesis protein
LKDRHTARNLTVSALLLLTILGAGICIPNRNLNVVKIPLGSKTELRPIMAHKGGETFFQVIERTKPYAAINGTFYDENARPLGDVIIGGKIVNRGHYRNGIAFKSNGTVTFLHVSRGRLSWRGYRAGLAAGPRLVHGGKVTLDPVADGFSKRSITLSAYRSGVGKTKDGQLLLVTSKTQMTLGEFAKGMLSLGAVEALNLDGGGACGLYCDGKYLARPYLQMTNVLAVYRR